MHLESLLRSYCPDITVIAAMTDITLGYKAVQAHQPDILFLDVEPEDERGFDLVHQFRDPRFEIIFTSAYEEYALEALKMQALDYLLKPIEIDELRAAILKAEQRIALKKANDRLQQILDRNDKNSDEKIALPILEGYKFVRPRDITYCKASGSYTTFFFADGSSDLVSIRLGGCEQLLPASTFFRVHHSYIVNLTYVDQYVKGRGGYLVLQDGGQIDVAVSRKGEFLRVIASHR